MMFKMSIWVSIKYREQNKGWNFLFLICTWFVFEVIVEISSLNISNPIWTGLFWFSCNSGGTDLPPPSKNECNEWEVHKLSWNLISYQDWCQTWGITTFRYLEPPQLMVWKSNFFRRSVRLDKMDQLFKFLGKRWFFGGQKCCTPFYTKNEEK